MSAIREKKTALYNLGNLAILWKCQQNNGHKGIQEKLQGEGSTWIMKLALRAWGIAACTS